MNQFILCFPTLNRYDLLNLAIESALNNPYPPDKIHIVDNGLKFSHVNSEKVTVWNLGRNIGVAGSWNFFMKLEKGPKIISNDDIIFKENTFSALINDYINKPDKMLFYPRGQSGSMFSLFLMRDELYETIGEFDESFYPAYYEDNDYYHRIELLYGMDVFYQSDCDYDHKKSSTIARFSNQQLRQHHSNFRKNQLYYRKKWGGLPGHELFNPPRS